MYIIHKISIVKIQLCILLFFFPLVFSHETKALQFFDGTPTTITDIRDPRETLYAGSDSGAGHLQTGTTNLTITTQRLVRNTLHTIYGGGRATNLQNNIVNGDVTLTVHNTNAQQIYGAGESLGALSRVTGSVYMNLTNTTFKTGVRGGIYGGANGRFGNVGGSVHINLDTVNTIAVYGSGLAQGIGSNNIAVEGDVNINAQNSTIKGIYLSSFIENAHVRGNATLTLTQSNVENVYGAGASSILGDVTINIRQGTIITKNVSPAVLNTIHGQIFINLEDSVVENLYLGPFGVNTHLNTVNATVTNSFVDTLKCGPNQRTSSLYEAKITIANSEVETLQLGSNRGRTTTATANIYDSIINTLVFGSVDQGQVDTTIANIAGGKINNIYLGATVYSVLNFTPGEKSIITKSINSQYIFDTVNIHKDAKTQWGNANNIFYLYTKNLKMSGELFIPEGTTIELGIQKKLTLDGGTIIPIALHATKDPPLQFIGTQQSTLTINSPLTINLSFSPNLIGVTHLPILIVDPPFVSPNFFVKNNYKGLIWSDTVFDPANNTWFLTNIRASEDFYGFSAAREATNWLRQQHTLSIQKHTNQTLEKNNNGLWINLQGGYEKLDAALGEAKMPWVMASMGYDSLHNLQTCCTIKTLYGFGLGVSKGNDTWATVNTTKNDILIGMLAGYLGLMHTSGVYTTATLQLAASTITTKCTGFSTNYKWKELIPTEAIELGWQHTFKNGLIINPRGHIIFEQLVKNHFKLPYENDIAILDKSFVATTTVGFSGEYQFHIGTPIDLQASIDWIHGLSGDFAAKSRLLKTTFKDTNDSSVIRTSLGLTIQLKEDVTIRCNAFVDTGNDKGVGGQLNTIYTF